MPLGKDGCLNTANIEILTFSMLNQFVFKCLDDVFFLAGKSTFFSSDSDLFSLITTEKTLMKLFYNLAKSVDVIVGHLVSQALSIIGPLSTHLHKSIHHDI